MGRDGFDSQINSSKSSSLNLICLRWATRTLSQQSFSHFAKEKHTLGPVYCIVLGCETSMALPKGCPLLEKQRASERNTKGGGGWGGATHGKPFLLPSLLSLLRFLESIQKQKVSKGCTLAHLLELKNKIRVFSRLKVGPIRQNDFTIRTSFANSFI